MGLEDNHTGVVDVICGKAFHFSGKKGEVVEEVAVPENMKVGDALIFSVVKVFNAWVPEWKSSSRSSYYSCYG